MVRLARAAAAAQAPISLAHWRETDADARTLRSDIWLVYAVLGMRTRNFKVEVVPDLPREGERFTHSFRDALVISRRTTVTQGFDAQ